MSARRAPVGRDARDLRRLLLRPDSTLRHAMEVIDREGIELAFVADENGRILGTLSDGDIRRAILGGMQLDTSGVHKAMHKKFTSVGSGAGRAEVLDLMRSLGIGVVPVVDGNGVITGVHLLYELIGANKKPNVAVLMAGGKGTRLRPLTHDVPKPMLPVAGRPMLERLVLQLVGAGVRTVYLSINYLGEIIERHFRDGERFGCEIRYLRERKPLGTGGALSLLPKSARRHPVLVMNGDLIIELDVSRVLQFHGEGRFSMTVCLKPYQVEIPFGVAAIRKQELVSMREKPKEQYLVNTGIYVVSDEALSLVPRNREFFMPELIERCSSRSLRVGAFQLDGDWLDVGRHEALKQARGQN